MAGPTGRGGPHAFVDDLDQPVLDGRRRAPPRPRAAAAARRPLTVSDGRGCVAAGPVRCPAASPTAPIVAVPAAGPVDHGRLRAGEGRAARVVVQKLTELGVDDILPFVAERSVVRWDRGEADPRRGAAGGGGPGGGDAEPPLLAARSCTRRAGSPTSPRWPVLRSPTVTAARSTSTHPVVLVGPEGGWSDDGARPRAGHGASRPQVLRAETAAIAAAALLAAAREQRLLTHTDAGLRGGAAGHPSWQGHSARLPTRTVVTYCGRPQAMGSGEHRNVANETDTDGELDGVAQVYGKKVGERLRAIRRQKGCPSRTSRRPPPRSSRPRCSVPTSAASGPSRCPASSAWPASTTCRSTSCSRATTRRLPGRRGRRRRPHRAPRPSRPARSPSTSPGSTSCTAPRPRCSPATSR